MGWSLDLELGPDLVRVRAGKAAMQQEGGNSQQLSYMSMIDEWYELQCKCVVGKGVFGTHTIREWGHQKAHPLGALVRMGVLAHHAEQMSQRQYHALHRLMETESRSVE